MRGTVPLLIAGSRRCPDYGMLRMSGAASARRHSHRDCSVVETLLAHERTAWPPAGYSILRVTRIMVAARDEQIRADKPARLRGRRRGDGFRGLAGAVTEGHAGVGGAVAGVMHIGSTGGADVADPRAADAKAPSLGARAEDDCAAGRRRPRRQQALAAVIDEAHKARCGAGRRAAGPGVEQAVAAALARRRPEHRDSRSSNRRCRCADSRLADAVVKAAGDRATALARSLALAAPRRRGSASSAARRSRTPPSASWSIIPGADMPVMTLNQVRMVLRIGCRLRQRRGAAASAGGPRRGRRRLRAARGGASGPEVRAGRRLGAQGRDRLRGHGGAGPRRRRVLRERRRRQARRRDRGAAGVARAAPAGAARGHAARPHRRRAGRRDALVAAGALDAPVTCGRLLTGSASRLRKSLAKGIRRMPNDPGTALTRAADLEGQLAALLQRVRRPGRYVGGEFNLRRKPGRGPLIVLSYPDVYEIGISNPALQILYTHLNDARPPSRPSARTAPGRTWPTSCAPRACRSGRSRAAAPCGEAAVWGFTLPHELTYTNVLEMLDLAGVPLLSRASAGRRTRRARRRPGDRQPAAAGGVLRRLLHRRGRGAPGRLAIAAAAGDRAEPSAAAGRGARASGCRGHRRVAGARVSRQVFGGVLDARRRSCDRWYRSWRRSTTAPSSRSCVAAPPAAASVRPARGIGRCASGPSTWSSMPRTRLLRETGCDEVSLISLSSCDYSGVAEAVSRVRALRPGAARVAAVAARRFRGGHPGRPRRGAAWIGDAGARGGDAGTAGRHQQARRRPAAAGGHRGGLPQRVHRPQAVFHDRAAGRDRRRRGAHRRGGRTSGRPGTRSGRRARPPVGQRVDVRAQGGDRVRRRVLRRLRRRAHAVRRLCASAGRAGCGWRPTTSRRRCWRPSSPAAALPPGSWCCAPGGTAPASTGGRSSSTSDPGRRPPGSWASTWRRRRRPRPPRRRSTPSHRTRFLAEELRRARSGELTGDCRGEGCQTCGVCAGDVGMDLLAGGEPEIAAQGRPAGAGKGTDG